MELIGKVRLNDTWYCGSDLYSDGDLIEEEMLDIARKGEWERELIKSNKWAILYHFSDIRGNIIEWYPMNKTETVLEIGAGCGAISGVLCRKAKKVVGIELSKRRSLINAYRNRDCDNLEIIVGNFRDVVLEEKFDYILLIGVLEYASLYMETDNPYEDMLRQIKNYLRPDGKIIIAIENKMGLKYLNGAKEDHVGRRFAGMEDYRYITGVRTFSRQELEKMLKNSGIGECSFYYPVPDYKLPDTIYSDECLPQKGDVRIWGTNYDSVRLSMYNDAIMADQICADGMFGYFSNSFLIIAGRTEKKIRYARYTRQRQKAYQTLTTIYETEERKQVKKQYLYTGKSEKNLFTDMEKYYPVLEEEFKNITYLPVRRGEDGSIQYPYLTGNTLEEFLFRKLHHHERLLESLVEIFNYIFCIDEGKKIPFVMTDKYKEIFGEWALEEGRMAIPISNLDMNLGNLILHEGKIYCFDYEWLFDFPIPIEFMKLRCMNVFHTKYNMYYSAKLKKEDIMQQIGISKEDFAVLIKMDQKFQEFVYGPGNESQYLQRYKKPCGILECRGI